MTSSRPTAIKKVLGVVFTRPTGDTVWTAIDGVYRIEIFKQGSPRHFLCTVYRLDPKFKEFNPDVPRIQQECILRDVCPKGLTLALLMENAVLAVRAHRDTHYALFANTRIIAGSDLKTHMRLFRNGAFHPIVHIAPRPAGGWDVRCEGGHHIIVGSTVTVTVAGE